MADLKVTSVPPRNLNGISRPGRGAVVVKPKNLKGTLYRLKHCSSFWLKHS